MKKTVLLAIFSTILLFGCGEPDPKPFILEALQLAQDKGENMKICVAGNCRDSNRILIKDLSLTNYPTTLTGRFVLQYNDGGTIKYIGIANEDWKSFLDAYGALTDPTAKELAITQFFQSNFDTFGMLTPPDPLPTDLNNPTYFTDKNSELFSETTDSGKDLELIGANMEEVHADRLGEVLIANYGLSTKRAQAVAKNISAYQKLSSKRALTEKERNFFSTELLGVNFKNAKNALTSGNAQDLNDLLEKAADKNGTSPEQISSILTELFL